ncbi:MAG: DNA polymerase III subunit alpha, partial [Bacteroidales bacterium]|nr:DNA polymerase III subunit alpha [Bacteroidales bacterium]
MDYIPQFIRRKEGSEEIQYDLPEMEEYLKDTYGVTVYQEQVMLLSQKLAGFTKGDADTLRKAMGKKKKDVLDKMKTKFMSGCEEHRLDRKICDKVWTDWEAFASYAFNKSHATCYAWIAYQTAYLKAHYPAEFMAAVLTNNLNAIDKISFYMEECKRMKIDLLGPDINESQANFTVNAQGAIRFGLCAVKNVGANVVEALVAEREANGPFQNIFDFVKRGSFKNLNKRCMESLVKAGAFDSFGTPIRSAYFYQRPHDDRNFIDQLIQYASQYQKNLASAQTSLFGDFEAAESDDSGFGVGFDIPEVEPWSMIAQAKNEKEVTGFYISDHPLNQYKFEIEQLTTVSVAQLKTLPPNWANRTLRFGFMVTNAFHGTAKTGKPYGKIMIEDFDDSYEWAFFGEPYLKFKHLFNVGDFLFAQGLVKPKWGHEMDKLELSATHMMPLGEALDYFAKSVEINLSLSCITPSLTQTLQELLNKHLVKSKKETSEGASVQFHVRSGELTLNMPVKAGRVRVSEFVQDLREADLAGLEYKIKK